MSKWITYIYDIGYFIDENIATVFTRHTDSQYCNNPKQQHRTEKKIMYNQNPA